MPGCAHIFRNKSLLVGSFLFSFARRDFSLL